MWLLFPVDFSISVMSSETIIHHAVERLSGVSRDCMK
jgi:hypothetical protein